LHIFNIYKNVVPLSIYGSLGFFRKFGENTDQIPARLGTSTNNFHTPPPRTTPNKNNQSINCTDVDECFSIHFFMGLPSYALTYIRLPIVFGSQLNERKWIIKCEIRGCKNKCKCEIL